MTAEPPRLLTRAQAAELLGLSYQAVGRLIRRGELPEYRYGPRRSRVSQADLITYLEPKRRDQR